MNCNQVNGMLDLLMDGALDEGQRRCSGSHRHTGSPLMDLMDSRSPHTSQPTSLQ